MPVPGSSAGPSLGRRLVANTIANLAGQGALIILGFVSTPYIVHHLGVALYGVLILLFAYIEAFALLDLGINVGLIKYLAEYLPQRRLTDVNAYLGTALTLFICGGTVIAGAVVVLAPRLAVYALNGQADLYSSVMFGLWVASAAFLVRFVGQTFSAVLIAVQRFDLANYVTIGSETLRIAGAMATLYEGYQLEAVILVSLLVNLLILGANIFLARRLVPEVSFKPRFSLRHCRTILHFSKFMVIANISGRLVHSADKVILGHLLSVASVGFYAVPYSLGQKLWVFAGSVTAVVLPAASALTGTRSTKQLTELYLRSSKFVAVAAGFPAVALWLFRHELLQYWIGPEFALNGAIALGFLSWGFLTNILAHIPAVVSQATGKPQVAACFAALNAILNIFLLIVLAPRFGIEGAAAAFLGSQLILTPWLVQTVNRSLGVSWLALLSRSYLPAAAACVIGALVCWLLQPFATSLSSLAAVGAMGLVIYASAALVIVFDRADRAACWSLLSLTASPSIRSEIKAKT